MVRREKHLFTTLCYICLSTDHQKKHANVVCKRRLYHLSLTAITSWTLKSTRTYISKDGSKEAVIRKSCVYCFWHHFSFSTKNWNKRTLPKQEFTDFSLINSSRTLSLTLKLSDVLIPSDVTDPHKPRVQFAFRVKTNTASFMDNDAAKYRNCTEL